MWENFVPMKYDRWEPTKYSAICSNYVYGTKDFSHHLKKDDVGISVFPSTWQVHAATLTEREKRQVCYNYSVADFYITLSFWKQNTT